MVSPTVAALIALFAGLALGACGTKGPLVLPPEKSPVAQVPTPAPTLPSTAPAPPAASLPSTVPLPSTAPPTDATRPPNANVAPGNSAPK